MKNILTIVRWFLGVGFIFFSFVFLVPAVPSEKVPPQKLELLDVSVVIPMTLFLVGNLMIKERYMILQSMNSSKKLYIALFLIYLCLHLLIRTFVWMLEPSAFYGNPLYNILVHSSVYAFLMTCIFILFTKKENIKSNAEQDEL